MRAKLKPLAEQVIVITGATSGIGLSTARAAAARGARLVLAARNETALKTVCHDLASKGCDVEYVVADVGRQVDVEKIALAAAKRFGGFDTWVNNAGVTIYGELTEVTIEDHRRLFETNYWGVVYGSLAAADHLARRAGGGVIVNVGSVLGDMAVPLQGAYSASKHAVHGFTAALRMELLRDKKPVSVTLIRPGAVDTPYKDNARTYGEAPWRNPQPVYAAPLVAQAILYAAEHRVRQITIGGLAGGLTAAAALIPGLAERLAAWLVPLLSVDRTGQPGAKRVSNLHQPGQDLRERAWYPQVREQSLATAAQMRPAATVGMMSAAAGLILTAFLVGRKLNRRQISEEI